MNRGVDASGVLRALLKQRDWTQKKLADETGIGSGTIAGYCTKNPDARRGLGIRNGRKIAAALGVDLSRLGLSEDGEDANDPEELRRTLASLQATVQTLRKSQRALLRRVTALEKAREEPELPAATPRRDGPAQTPTAEPA